MESEDAKRILNINNLSIEKFIQWSRSTPGFTTFRANTCKTSTIEHIIKVVEDQLKVQAEARNVAQIPEVKQDSLFKECVVVDNWNTSKQQLGEATWKEKGKAEGENEVIVDTRCGVAILRGANIFAPGVLAMTPGAKVGDTVSVYADISKKCLRGSMKCYKDPSRMFLGRGLVIIDRQTIFQSNKPLTGVAVEMLATVSRVPSVTFPGHLGLLQNYPSIVCCHVLDAGQSDVLLDMCAAPGNKASHLASLISPKGRIIAIDKTKNKVRRMVENFKRQSLDNVETYVYDSTRLVAVADEGGSDCVERGPPFAPCSFERILLDAPCSALGQRPQLEPPSLSDHHLSTYPVVQRKLFAQAIQLLKEGGVLVYSTCTLALNENEKMVAWVLRQFPEIVLLPAHPIVAGPGDFHCGLTEEQCKMVQKFGPACEDGDVSHQTDTIGFFIAKFTKCKNS